MLNFVWYFVAILSTICAASAAAAGTSASWLSPLWLLKSMNFFHCGFNTGFPHVSKQDERQWPFRLTAWRVVSYFDLHLYPCILIPRPWASQVPAHALFMEIPPSKNLIFQKMRIVWRDFCWKQKGQIDGLLWELFAKKKNVHSEKYHVVRSFCLKNKMSNR